MHFDPVAQFRARACDVTQAHRGAASTDLALAAGAAGGGVSGGGRPRDELDFLQRRAPQLHQVVPDRTNKDQH